VEFHPRQSGRTTGYKLCGFGRDLRNDQRAQTSPGHWQRLKLKRPVEQIVLPEVGHTTPLEIEPPRKAKKRRTYPAPLVEQTAEIKTATVFPDSFSVGPGKLTVAQATASPAQQGKVSPVVQFTRQELYEAVWKTPCHKLAASLGISDVGLAKTCKRLGIPNPLSGLLGEGRSRGNTSENQPPPCGTRHERSVTFNVVANLQRRKVWVTANRSASAIEEIATRLELPVEQTPLQPLAQKHRQALEKEKPDEDGMVRIDKKDLFRCTLAAANIPRLCRALHALILELEGKGHKFRASQEPYWNLRIMKIDDFTSIECTEKEEEITREPTQEEKLRPEWAWQLKSKKPTNQFSFVIRTRPCLRGRHAWSETDRKSLEDVIGIVAEKIDRIFLRHEEERRFAVECAKRRVQEERIEAEHRKEEHRLLVEKQRQKAERDRLESHKSCCPRLLATEGTF
jgi:hypothetical protein